MAFWNLRGRREETMPHRPSLRSTLPPGPHVAPIQTFRYMRDPYAYYEWAAARWVAACSCARLTFLIKMSFSAAAR